MGEPRMTAERLAKIERDPNGVGCLGTVRDLIHDLRLVRERAERLERELKEESEAKWTARKATQEAENEKAELEARLGRATAVIEAARRLKDAEAIDRKHGFFLPGDSALAVYLNTLDERLAVLVEQEKEQ